MGRSTMPAYRLEMKLADGQTCRCAWQVNGRANRPGDGVPNDDNVRRYVELQQETYQEGRVNAHLVGIVIVAARLIRQRDGKHERPAKIRVIVADELFVSPRNRMGRRISRC